MKKLFAVAIAISMLSGLYAMKLGLGAAYENIAGGPEDSDPWLVIKADARVPLMPIIDVRGQLLSYSMREGFSGIFFGTFIDSDLMIKFPMPMPFQPYLALGLWFTKMMEDAPNDYMGINLKAALGGEMSLGSMDAYLELGLNKLEWTDIEGSDTNTPLFVQAGVVFPLKFD